MNGTPRAPGGSAEHDPTGCQVGDLFRLLGRPHAMALLDLLVHDGAELRFGEIQDTLGISPKTLTARLRDLVAAGLLTRTAHNEIPPRVDYAATPKALKLCPSFTALRAWADENDLQVDAEVEEEAVAATK